MNDKAQVVATSEGTPTVNERRSKAMKSNRNAERSGHYRRKAQLQAVSFDDLHRNSSGGAQLFERKDELIEHCGGDEHVSAVTRRVIERTCLTEYLLDHVISTWCNSDPRLSAGATRVSFRSWPSVVVCWTPYSSFTG